MIPNKAVSRSTEAVKQAQQMGSSHITERARLRQAFEAGLDMMTHIFQRDQQPPEPKLAAGIRNFGEICQVQKPLRFRFRYIDGQLHIAQSLQNNVLPVLSSAAEKVCATAFLAGGAVLSSKYVAGVNRLPDGANVPDNLGLHKASALQCFDSFSAKEKDTEKFLDAVWNQCSIYGSETY